MQDGKCQRVAFSFCFVLTTHSPHRNMPISCKVLRADIRQTGCCESFHSRPFHNTPNEQGVLNILALDRVPSASARLQHTETHRGQSNVSDLSITRGFN